MEWKYPSILLFGIGISNIGEWVYFLALNLIVFDMTGSPLAVSVLYIMNPLATVLMNFWVGSLIDRLNKKKLLILLDIIRALLIACLPLMPSLIYMYGLVLMINMASSMFDTTSIVYITKLIPENKRKSFNALLSFVTSGAFLTGPAVAGLIFLTGSPNLAIYTNAFALFISGLIMLLMPDLEKEIDREASMKLTFHMVKEDFFAVMDFSKRFRLVMIIYFVFNGVMFIIASAVDSLEVAFAKEVLSLSDSSYGFLVSVAGFGIVVGALVNTLIVKKVKAASLIGIGTLFVSIGYVIYGFSNSILQASIGFFILAFFTAGANTGFLTFFQNSVPVEMMGRIESVYSLINSGFIMILTVGLGAMANGMNTKLAVILGVLSMLILSITLFFIIRSSKTVSSLNSY